MNTEQKDDYRFYGKVFLIFLSISVVFMAIATGCAEKFVENSPPVCGHWDKTTNGGYVWSEK